MRNYVILALLSCSGWLVACQSTASSVAEAPTHPNIVLIVADDLGWKDLSCMGSTYYETPNLDALAAAGLRFTNAYAGAANCAPSRACLLSGLNTPRHGIYTVSPSERGNKKTRKLIPIPNTDFLDSTHYLLPQMLKSAGYVTSNFGKWHVGEDPATQGIDYNVGGSHRGNPGQDGYFSPYAIDFIENGPDGEYLTDRLTTEALQFMEQQADTSFFLYVPYYTVHTPIMGKAEKVAKYEQKPPSQGHNRADYAAMVESLDENVGRILEKLAALGLEEETIVLFTSDNGGLLRVTNQQPLRAGKGAYYEGGIRVPLLIRWPGKVPAGQTEAARVTNLDFYPTLQTIVQPVQAATTLDGMDLAPLFRGEALAARSLYFHFPIYLQSSNAIQGLRDPLFRTRPGSVVIDGDWKLHHYFEDDVVELYNLSTDPSESTDLALREPEIKERLWQQLTNWRTATNAPVPQSLNPDYDAPFEQAAMDRKRTNAEK